MTVYFTAGGLLGTAWVNTLQLVVMLAGFVVALPFVLQGRWRPRRRCLGRRLPSWFGDFTYSAGPGSGWTLLALTGPAFIVSPGLIQKAYGGASARAVRTGVALNAVALLAVRVRAGAARDGGARDACRDHRSATRCCRRC